MAIIGQRNIFCTVNKEGPQIVARAFTLTKEFEASAQLAVGIHDYLIHEAEWEISKAKDAELLGRGFLADAIGVMSITGLGSVLVSLTPANGGAPIKPLFFECVKGLMQAETYLFKERGYPDEAAYEAYWMDKESNGCRFYTHPTQDTSGWFEHIGPYHRTQNLFNRCKNYQLSSHGGELTLNGTFQDSYHEMAGEIRFDKGTGTILECSLTMFRAPGDSCRETTVHGQTFVGKNIYALTRKQVISMVGGPQGCYHLTDLLADMLPLVHEHNPEREDSK
jgi:hypothetical protein